MCFLASFWVSNMDLKNTRFTEKWLLIVGIVLRLTQGPCKRPTDRELLIVHAWKTILQPTFPYPHHHLLLKLGGVFERSACCQARHNCLSCFHISGLGCMTHPTYHMDHSPVRAGGKTCGMNPLCEFGGDGVCCCRCCAVCLTQHSRLTPKDAKFWKNSWPEDCSLTKEEGAAK